MGFNNPIVGGTALRIPAIQSPNYNPGVDGWIIKIDGSAEFNDLVVRGEFSGTDFIINGDGIFLYSSTPALGNLAGSWAPAAGTDAFGNAYAAGLTLYSSDGTINLFDTAATWNAIPSGAGIQIAVGGGSVSQSFAPSTVTGVTWNDGGVGATLQSRLGTNTPLVFLESPGNSANPGATATITLYGAPQTSNGDVLSECIVDASRTWVNSSIGWVTGAWIKEAETWHAPSYNANWSGTTTFGTISGGLATLKYRFDAEDNLWLLGCFKAAAGAGASVFNLPNTGYRPVTNGAFPVAFISSGGVAGNAWMYVSAAGNLNINSQLGSAVTTGTTYYVNGKIPLENV